MMAGFTLLEVLVSLAILAFGLLGVAGLQVAGMRNAHNADARSTALYLAYDIMDRVRANRYSCKQGTIRPAVGTAGYPGDCYDLNLTSASYNSFATTTPTLTCVGSTANCAADKLAIADVWNWQQKVRALLPRGEAVVCNDSTPNDGQPTWANGGSAGTTQYGCDGLATAANACSACGSVAPVLTVKIWWDDRLKNSAADTTTYRRLYMSFQP
jgi:type IV pilus assembly protein PilV